MTAKGCDGIKTAALRRQESLDINPGQKVHTACRKEYCALRSKRSSDDIAAPNTPEKATRSSSPFEYQSNCLFCGKADQGIKHWCKLC